MKQRYKTVFILPTNTKKVLGDDGWEFDTPERLSSHVLKSLITKLQLQFLEHYSGIDVYHNPDVKMSIIHDDAELIEYISFQINEDFLNSFKGLLSTFPWFKQVDCFIPSEENSF